MQSFPTSVSLQQEDMRLKTDLNKWLSLEEEQLRQKSRELWLQLGQP